MFSKATDRAAQKLGWVCWFAIGGALAGPLDAERGFRTH